MASRMLRSRMLVALIAMVAMSLTACESPQDTEVEETETTTGDPDFVLDGDPENGQELYTIHCASCHGADGDGAGPAGAALNPPPNDFTEEALSPGHIYTVTRDGGMAAGLAATMPPFENQLDESELHDVTAYVLTFAP